MEEQVDPWQQKPQWFADFEAYFDIKFAKFFAKMDHCIQPGMSPVEGGACVLSPAENHAESKHNGGGQPLVTLVTTSKVYDPINNQGAAINSPDIVPGVTSQVTVNQQVDLQASPRNNVIQGSRNKDSDYETLTISKESLNDNSLVIQKEITMKVCSDKVVTQDLDFNLATMPMVEVFPLTLQGLSDQKSTPIGKTATMKIVLSPVLQGRIDKRLTKSVSLSNLTSTGVIKSIISEVLFNYRKRKKFSNC